MTESEYRLFDEIGHEPGDPQRCDRCDEDEYVWTDEGTQEKVFRVFQVGERVLCQICLSREIDEVAAAMGMIPKKKKIVVPASVNWKAEGF